MVTSGLGKAKGAKKRPRGRPPKVRPEDIISTERRAEALALRKQGYDYATIGASLTPPCTAQNAHLLVKGALQELVPDQAAALREMMAAQLDDLLTGVWEKALKGDSFAIGDAMKILDRKARLFGVDAPARVAVEGKDGGPIRSEAEVKITRIERVIVDPSDPDAAGVRPAAGAGPV